MNTAVWNARASALLKAELKRRRVTYEELAKRLTGIGIQENKYSIANKLSRGAFSAAFYLAACEVIGAKPSDFPNL